MYVFYADLESGKITFREFPKFTGGSTGSPFPQFIIKDPGIADF